MFENFSVMRVMFSNISFVYLYFLLYISSWIINHHKNNYIDCLKLSIFSVQYQFLLPLLGLTCLYWESANTLKNKYGEKYWFISGLFPFIWDHVQWNPCGFRTLWYFQMVIDAVVAAIYCHPVFLTYMQSTSCEMPGWMKHKLGIKIARRNSNNLRCTDDTTLMAESEEELKNLLMKVKEGRENSDLKLNIQKTKIMAFVPSLHGK